jgi:hypothetical protein
MRNAGKKALSTGTNVNGSLKWEVFVAPGVPWLSTRAVNP